MAYSPKSVLFRILIDSLILGSCGLFLLLYKVLGQPYQRGFFCDDESLMYPYHQSTITSSVLYSVGFIVPLFTFVLVETARTIFHDKKEPLPSGGQLHLFYKNFYFVFVPFVFGAAVEHLTTDIGKYSIGRLSPHFFDVCKPDLSQVNCTTYVLDAVCIGNEYSKEARLSFPSGHASFSMYTMVFNILYLQSRIHFKFSILVKPFVQLLLFFMAFYTCLSRVFDYKNHWSDVFFGAFIGIFVAFVTAYRFAGLFSRKKESPQNSESICELTTSNYQKHSDSDTFNGRP